MKLGYEYNALEPYIDAKTMEIHHSKHHQTYVDKLNAALGSLPVRSLPQELVMNAEELLKNLNKISVSIRTAIQNNDGGVVNHNFFFSILKKEIKISGEIKIAIEDKFGSFEKFKEEFSKSALSLFGSGWTWLVLDEGKLKIMNTSNQDSPLSLGKIPLLVIDVWEHAYYLKYQNRRAEYIENFFNVINWEKVNEIYIEMNRNG